LKKIAILLGLVLFLAGCSQPNKEALLFEEFIQHFSEGDFDAMYGLLTTEAQERISRDDFIQRYTNIFTYALGAHNLEFEKGERENEGTIPFTLSMETVGGTISFDYQLPYVSEGEGLRVDWTEALIFPMMQPGDTVQSEQTLAERGRILDRNGVELAYNGTLRQIYLLPGTFDHNRIAEVAEALDVSVEAITQVLDGATGDSPVPFIRLRQDSPHLQDLRDGGFVTEVQGSDVPSRLYADDEAFGHLLGFVATITEEQLNAAEPGIYGGASIVGQRGLEQVHEATLRAIHGFKLYISRDGTNIQTLIDRPAANGQDLRLTIDSGLQIDLYHTMAGEEGNAAAVAPKTGEILALVSSPSFNSNQFMTYTTLTDAALWDLRGVNPRDVVSRFSQVYSPGSTFKLHTAASGLEAGTLDPTVQRTIDGPQWQQDNSWGGSFVTRINNQTRIGLLEAVKYSDNIYFAQEALAMGKDAFLSGVGRFTIGTDLSIGFPLQPSQVVGTGDLSDDVLLADTGFGQGQILTTTVNMAADYSMLSNQGVIMSPTLILDGFTPAPLKTDVVSPQNLAILQEMFVEAVSGAGATGELAQIPGVRLAGKTGTAETSVELGGDAPQRGWFVATDIDSSRISLAMMVDDNREVENGTRGVSAMVGQVIERYLAR